MKFHRLAQRVLLAPNRIQLALQAAIFRTQDFHILLAQLHLQIRKKRHLSVRRAARPSVVVALPFFTEAVPAGVPTSIYSDNVERLTIGKSFIKRPSKCFAVRAVGNSMTGASIESGDILVVERDLSGGKIVIARLNGTEITVKRLKISKNSEISLVPANKSHKIIKIASENDAVIIGAVILIIREI